ncbi:MAG: sulfatase [Planctomycetota bacterium]
MHRFSRPFLAYAAACVASLTAGSVALSAEPIETTPPNIVVFTVDDMDYTSVNALGNPMPGLTPHMDRLVREGTTFTHAHVSTPACAPARQSMMTGLHPHSNGSYGFIKVHPDVTSLTDLLGQRGYFRASLGKGGAYDAFVWDVIERYLPNYGRTAEDHVQHVERVLDRARQAGKPLYLGVNTHDPHRPFPNSRQMAEWIQHRQRNHPDWENPPEPKFPPFTTAEKAHPIPYVPDLPDIRQETAEYYTAVRRADHILGQVLAVLEERGLLEDTLFVFFSDHAASLPKGKNNLYKHSTQTPLIIRWPGRVPADIRHDASMVSTLDLMPTILEAAGLTPPGDLDGQSLWPLLRGESQPRRDAVLTTINFKQPGNRVLPTRALNTAWYSYIVNFWPDGRRKDTENHHGLSMRAIEHAAQHDTEMAALAEFLRFRRVNGEYVREELYDLAQDPWSEHNLANDPDYAEALEQMRQRMADEMARTGDPLLPAFRDGSRYPAWWDDKAEMKKRGFKIIH